MDNFMDRFTGRMNSQGNTRNQSVRGGDEYYGYGNSERSSGRSANAEVIRDMKRSIDDGFDQQAGMMSDFMKYIDENSKASAKSTEDMKSLLQKKLDDTNAAFAKNNEDINTALSKNAEAMNEVITKNTADNAAAIAKNNEDIGAIIDRSLNGIKEAVDDSVHREDVKCYRNVQAVVEDNSKKISELVVNTDDTVVKRTAGIKPLLVWILIFLLVNMGATGLLIAHIFFGAI